MQTNCTTIVRLMAKNTQIQGKKMRIVFLDSHGLTDYLESQSIDLASDWINHSTTQPEAIVERAQNADILVVNKVLIGDQILRACPNIKHIAVAATGYNVIDMAACAKRGVSVSNIPNYAGVSVPEHVIGIALSLRRELIQYRQQVINQHWQNSPTFCLFDKPILDLKDSVFGVIGFGQLGQATARLAKALGMRVIYNSRSQHPSEFAEYASLDELIARSDIISLHCSLTPETKNLIDTSELKAMKNSAILINTARGGVANEQAVADALKQGLIAGIGFDVLTQEPPVNESPLLEIADRTNVIITPHIAWASESAIQNLCDVLVSNVHSFINNQPVNLVS